MTTDINKGDYCVAEVANEEGKAKRYLLKVTGFSSDGKEINSRLEDVPHIKEVGITVQSKQVILNLGRKPYPGKVYGFDLERLYLTSHEHDAFGDVHFFCRPSKEEIKKLWSSMDHVAEKLKKHGLSRVFELPCTVEVIPKNGKYAGRYIHPANLTKNPGRLQFSVGEETLKTASINSYSYVVFHELGHLIHFQALKDFPKLNAQWVELYSSSIGPLAVTGERSMEIGKSLLANPEAGMKGFYSEADEETRAELKLILKWVREIKNIHTKELDLLLRADSKSAIKVFKSIWPIIDVQSKALKPIISEYATKDVFECVAESFAFYMCNKKLPERVTELLEKSLGLARGAMKKLTTPD